MQITCYEFIPSEQLLQRCIDLIHTSKRISLLEAEAHYDELLED